VPNTIKLSYRCTPSISTVISARNAKLLADPPAPDIKTCSCPKTKKCPLEKKCLSKNIIYKATITQDNHKTETYTGLTSNTFKARLGTHKTSFKNPNVNQTSLSNHIKKLENKNITHSIKWEILSSAKPFSPVSGICSLCTKEKFYITFKPEMATLNKKSEMYSNCRHKKRVLLCRDKT
jgi:hypothetical protein